MRRLQFLVVRTVKDYPQAERGLGQPATVVSIAEFLMTSNSYKPDNTDNPFW